MMMLNNTMRRREGRKWEGCARAGVLILVLVAGTAAAGTGVEAGGELQPLPFDHLMRHAELSALLAQWAAQRPQLMTLESLGRTPEGREMWFITLTNRETGPALHKPALLVDGSTHAAEGAGGVAALHFAWRLLEGYGGHDEVTRLLDTRTVYILPRLSPDGVDAVLAEGRFIRSVNRPYPEAEAAPGLHMSDVDGDGRVVFMRFRDPNGPWKQHPEEPRIMIARDIDEVGGEYWRVLPEGLIEGYDGVTIGDPPAAEGLDLGANFPGDRGSGPRSASAGDYPASEPEVAAYVAAVTARPNIVAHVTCHTFGGLILTPPVNRSEQLPASDRRRYETLAGRGAEITGYTAMTYLRLRGENSDAYIPSAFGWLWEQLGIFSHITELWNPLKAAGISLERTTASDWLWGFHPVEDELKLLAWSDAELGGRAFVEWHAFDHPQLGPVEIGGWDKVGFFYNVPFERLEAEVAPHSEWLIMHTLALPQLAIRSLSAEALGEELWRVRLVLENRGWLPTNGSQQALDRAVVGEVEAEIELPAGARLADGTLRRGVGQLAGRSEQRSTATWWSYVPGTPDRGVVDWLVRAPAGATVVVTARHERAGSVHGELVLER